MRLFITLLTAFVLLGACKADKSEVELQHSDIVEAFQSGTSKNIDFQASFSAFGEIDDYQSELDELQEISSQFLDIDVFEIDRNDFGFEVTIKGQIPLTNDPETPSPYILLVEESKLFPNHMSVSLSNGSSFDRFSQAAERVNFLLSPDQFQPIKFRISANGKAVVAGGVRTDGRAYGVFGGVLNGDQSFLFQGGAYDEAAAELHIEI